MCANENAAARDKPERHTAGDGAAYVYYASRIAIINRIPSNSIP